MGVGRLIKVFQIWVVADFAFSSILPSFMVSLINPTIDSGRHELGVRKMGTFDKQPETFQKKIRLLVIVTLSLALTMIVSIPPNITASQEATQNHRPTHS